MENGFLYESIVSDLKTRIESGELEEGERLPTEAELVEQFHVSRTTVIKALHELKRNGYIVRYPKKGTFVAKREEPALPEKPDPPAYKPEYVSERADIAFIIPTVSDLYALNMIRGISSVFQRDSYRLNIIQSYDARSEEDFLATAVNKGAAGIVLFPVDHPYYSDIILQIRLNSFPIVLVDRMMEKINLDYVVGDNHLGGYLMAGHLYSLGHRHIAFVTTCRELPTSVRDRIRGLRDFFAEKGIGADAVSVCDSFDIEAPFEAAREPAAEIVRQHTAVFLSESGAALYMYGLLQEMGISVPDRVSLACFDNPVNDLAPFDIFTYVDQSEQRIAMTAARILYNRINHIEGGQTQVVIRPFLHEGKTTGTVRTD